MPKSQKDNAVRVIIKTAIFVIFKNWLRKFITEETSSLWQFVERYLVNLVDLELNMCNSFKLLLNKLIEIQAVFNGSFRCVFEMHVPRNVRNQRF